MAEPVKEESLEELERSVLSLCGETGQDAEFTAIELLTPSSQAAEHGSIAPISPIHLSGPQRSAAVCSSAFCHSTPNPKARDCSKQGFSLSGANDMREKTFEEILAEVSSLCEDWDHGLDNTVVENKDTRGQSFKASISKIDWSSRCTRQAKIAPYSASLTEGQKASAADISQPGYFAMRESSAPPSSPGRFSDVDTSHLSSKTLCAEEKMEEEEDTLDLDRYVSFAEDDDGPQPDEETQDSADAAWVTLSKAEMDRDITSVEPPQPSFSQEPGSGAVLDGLPCFTFDNSLENSVNGGGNDTTLTPEDNTENDWIPVILEGVGCDSLLTADAGMASPKERDAVSVEPHHTTTPGAKGLNLSTSGKNSCKAGGSGTATLLSVRESIGNKETVQGKTYHKAQGADVTSTKQMTTPSSHGSPETSTPSSFTHLAETVAKKEDASLIARKRKLSGNSQPSGMSAKTFWSSAVKEAKDVEPPSKMMAGVKRAPESDRPDQGPSQVKSSLELPDRAKQVQPERPPVEVTKSRINSQVGGTGGTGARDKVLASKSQVSRESAASSVPAQARPSVSRPEAVHQIPGRKDIISAEENKLMREVRKRWETGIMRPDVNLTSCNYLHRQRPGTTSLLEGNFRKPPLLRHLDRLQSGGRDPGQSGAPDFSSSCVSLLEELKHQLEALRRDHNQKEQAAKWELYRQVQELLQEQETWGHWLQQEQHKEQEEVAHRLAGCPLLQEHRLLLLQEEHQQQRLQQRQHYQQRIRVLSQQARDREQQDRQRFQHLERQLVEMVQLFGQKDSQQAGERHVLVSLWKGPCRANNNRRSWVQVGLPADIASYIWREDNIYDFFYSYQ